MMAWPPTLKSWRGHGQTWLQHPNAAALGVYYIAGNHEEFYRNAEYLPPLLRAGIRVLNNEKLKSMGCSLLACTIGTQSTPTDTAQYCNA